MYSTYVSLLFTSNFIYFLHFYQLKIFVCTFWIAKEFFSPATLPFIFFSSDSFCPESFWNCYIVLEEKNFAQISWTQWLRYSDHIGTVSTLFSYHEPFSSWSGKNAITHIQVFQKIIAGWLPVSTTPNGKIITVCRWHRGLICTGLTRTSKIEVDPGFRLNWRYIDHRCHWHRW